MKKIKYLILLLVIVLFTGCSVKYDLNIDDDLSVTERVEASEKETDVKTNTGLVSESAVNYLYDIYKRDGINPSISSKIEKNSLVTVASTSHDTLDDYVSNFTSDIFKKAKLSKSGNSYTLSFKQTEKLSSRAARAPVYDKVDISITLPYKVTNHNADKVHKNTYTWEIRKDQELRNLKISFDTTTKNDSKIFNFGFFKIQIKYSVLAVISILSVILLIVGIVYSNNKKNNRI